MASYTNVNIKQLRQIEEIVGGNFLIVETNNGTNIIDFKNFVVGPENVSFYSSFAALCAQVTSLSSYIDNTTTNLSASVDETISTRIQSLCDTVNAKYGRVFYQAGFLTVESNNSTSDAVAIVVPEGVQLNLSDINLNFASTVFTTNTGETMNVYGEINGSSPVYTLQASLTYPCVNNVVISYNVFKPY